MLVKVKTLLVRTKDSISEGKDSISEGKVSLVRQAEASRVSEEEVEGVAETQSIEGGKVLKMVKKGEAKELSEKVLRSFSSPPPLDLGREAELWTNTDIEADTEGEERANRAFSRASSSKEKRASC